MYKLYDYEKAFKGNIRIIESNDEYKKYVMDSKNGSGTMTIYPVFNGIELIYSDFDSYSAYTEAIEDPNIISINHCFKGRFEYKIDDRYIYIGEGDLAISTLKNSAKETDFPPNKYEGYSLMVDVDIASKMVCEILKGVSINIKGLLDKLALSNNYFVIRANESIQHVFTELYHVKPSIRKGYFKLKVLEILLFLTCDEHLSSISDKRYYTYAQVERIKSAKEYLISDLSRHITIDELSNKYKLSKTSLKDGFKDIYGDSPYSYLKKYRIHTAGSMLRESDKSISEIAGFLGYQNASKFSKAFKDVNGVSPREYRKN